MGSQPVAGDGCGEKSEDGERWDETLSSEFLEICAIGSPGGRYGLRRRELGKTRLKSSCDDVARVVEISSSERAGH